MIRKISKSPQIKDKLKYLCTLTLQREGLRLRAIGRIKSLTALNGQLVLEQESAAALRMAAGSRISQVSVDKLNTI